MKITMFKNVWEKDAPHYVSVFTALERVKKGNSKELIEQVRSGNKEAKKSLPVVCFSGEFSSRSDDALFEHSGLIVLDFDHIDVQQSKSLLATDEFVFAVWVSPSGDGLKALIRITNPERHRDHFRALKSYFDKSYGLDVDESGINESRACFESYDPDVIINSDSKKFGAFQSEMAELQVAKQDGIATDYMKLNLAAVMIRKAEDGEKHHVLLKASRLVGGFIGAGRIEEDEAIRVLMREISKKDIDSEQSAMNTIRDGIEEGKQDPIRDVLASEKDVKREMMINDGDMSFISSDDEDSKWIEKFANGEIELGLTTGNEDFDKYFRYKKNLLIMNGHSNVGKTTVALYMMVNASLRHNWTWVIYSSENKTASIKMKLMEFATNRKVGSMTYQQRKTSFEWVSKHFVIISNKDVYNYTDILVFMEKVMTQQRMDGCFIDPYNSLKLDLSQAGGNSHDYHYQAASEFLTFSNANDVAVWVNMHAVTEAQRRKGDDGLPTAPYAEDTEGGGKFVNRADTFITVHRKIQSPDPHTRRTSEWHVRKEREQETGGEPTPFDSPLTMSMNSSATAFIVGNNGEKLFEPLGNQFEEYRAFNINSNLSFLAE